MFWRRLLRRKIPCDLYLAFDYGPKFNYWVTRCEVHRMTFSSEECPKKGTTRYTWRKKK